MANREDVFKALTIQRERFLAEGTYHYFSGWTKVVQYHFTDLPEVWHLRFVNGIIEGPNEGEINKPEIYFKMPAQTFLDITYGKMSGLKAFRLGKVKIKATPAELLKLSRLDNRVGGNE